MKPGWVVTAIAMAIAGCVLDRPPDAMMATARSDVRAAEADPTVSLFALSDLETAERELQVAETGSPVRARQAAYLASQHARLALICAGVERDHVRLAAAQREGDRLQLAAQVRESTATPR